jgi:DNA-binding NtrC family response regulator
MNTPDATPENMSRPNRFSCLMVDDDAGFVSMLAKVIEAEGGLVTHCGDLKSARAEVARRAFDFVVLDDRLPDGTGFDFFPQLSRSCPTGIVVMVTGAPDISRAVQLTRNGLFDYLPKPVNVADFTACLRRVWQRLTHPDQAGGSGELVGESVAMREVVNSLRRAARHATATVLLTGETGSGKDLAARLLHRLTFGEAGVRAPYVPVNCSAVPAEMFESELFGCEKGAFTGADRRREGLIETAAGGTLFLDEITETPLPQQSKLLRFLESREYRPLGGGTLREFTGRIVVATNRSLADEVWRGRFREDLMYRLAVETIRLPALRERISDLDLLAENILSQLGEKYRRKKPFLTPGDAGALREYRFPGNVRELRNLLERALLRTPDEAAWLVFDRAWLSSGPAGEPPPNPAGPVGSAPASRQMNPLEQQEFRLIQEALHEEGGGIRRAAARLGITHQALLRRLEKWPELRQLAPRPA